MHALTRTHTHTQNHTHVYTHTSVSMVGTHARLSTQGVASSSLFGETGVTADRDKIEFRLFNSSSIFNITLREELISYRSKTTPCILILVSWR